MNDIEQIDEGAGKKTFWTKFYNFRYNRNDYQLNEPEFREYLKQEGFRTYKNDPIKIIGKIAEKVNPEQIFLHTLKYSEEFNIPELEGVFIKRGETLLLKSKAIVLSLPECDLKPLRDSQLLSYKFYKQGIVVVESGKEFEILPYEEAPGFVWKNAIINREFKLFSEDQLEKGHFATFVSNVTNNKDHFDSVCSAIGYMLHGYKDPRKPIAILINDENVIDEGKPEGGSGKGLLVKGVSKIVEKASYNGKNADFTKDKFAYQNVTDTTKILFIDDVPRNFNFEDLFSALTDDLPVEKKHQQTKVLPFEESPKLSLPRITQLTGTVQVIKEEGSKFS